MDTIKDDEGVQSAVYTDNDDSMQGSENARIEMGSAVSTGDAAVAPKDEENSCVDCESDFGDNRQNDASNLSNDEMRDASANCKATSEVNNREEATNESQSTVDETCGDDCDATKCEAVNQVLINESDVSRGEREEESAIDGRERKRPDEDYDFDMELIIKSFSTSAKKRTEKERKKPPARSERVSYSSEEEEESAVEDEEALAKCKWPGCDAEASKDSIVFHERSCGMRRTLCKWPKCHTELALRDRDEHEENCERGLRVCKWWTCDAELPPEEIEVHVSQCGGEIVECKWPKCGEKVERSDWDNHHWTCSYRADSRFTADCWICNRFSGENPASLVRHLLEVHPDRFEKSSERVLSLARGDFWQDSYRLSHGEVFRCVSGFWSGGCVKFYAERCGACDDGTNFLLEVELFHPFDDIMETLRVQSECSDLNGNSNFIKIEASDVEPFVHSEQVFFFCRILKKIV